MNKLLQELHDMGGVVAASDWTNGHGRWTKRKAMPRYSGEVYAGYIDGVLKGEVLKNAKALLKRRPKITKFVAITNLRAARGVLNKDVVNKDVVNNMPLNQLIEVSKILEGVK